jgi:hypothetical protein
VKHQGRDYQVDTRVRQEVEGIVEIGMVKFRTVAEARAGDLEHRLTDVEGNDVSAVIHKPFGEGTTPAAHLQHPLSRDIAEEIESRGTLVPSIRSARSVVSVVLDRHGVILSSCSRPVEVVHRSTLAAGARPTSSAEIAPDLPLESHQVLIAYATLTVDDVRSSPNGMACRREILDHPAATEAAAGRLISILQRVARMLVHARVRRRNDAA